MPSLANKVYTKFRIGTYLSALERAFWKPFTIMDTRRTIDYIIEHRCSIARFGDGEFNIAAYGCGLRFQREDPELQKALIQVMRSKDPDLLLCLPWWVNAVKECDQKNLGPIQKNGIQNNLHDWLKHFSRKRIYGDANISRLTDTILFSTRKEQVYYTKRIWGNRNVILVEGQQTRFGVGNDLLDNALSVVRILGPSESAFDFMDQLIEATVRECHKKESPIVLLALGPTATVMAHKLSKLSIQAIDIGHLDICYEVSMRNTSANGIPVPRDNPIPGKYTSEAVGGDVVDDCDDSKYIAEVVFRSE